jgi:hypothetical protein
MYAKIYSFPDYRHQLFLKRNLTQLHEAFRFYQPSRWTERIDAVSSRQIGYADWAICGEHLGATSEPSARCDFTPSRRFHPSCRLSHDCYGGVAPCSVINLILGRTSCLSIPLSSHVAFLLEPDLYVAPLRIPGYRTRQISDRSL